jgi:hypothetical protein
MIREDLHYPKLLMKAFHGMKATDGQDLPG